MKQHIRFGPDDKDRDYALMKLNKMLDNLDEIGDRFREIHHKLEKLK